MHAPGRGARLDEGHGRLPVVLYHGGGVCITEALRWRPKEEEAIHEDDGKADGKDERVGQEDAPPDEQGADEEDRQPSDALLCCRAGEGVAVPHPRGSCLAEEGCK